VYLSKCYEEPERQREAKAFAEKRKEINEKTVQ
jgi:hypothetical protein